MTLLLLAALGFVLGYRLGMAMRGFVTLAAVSISASALQVAHLAMTSDRSRMTMGPLIAGTVVVASMLVGAFERRGVHPSHTA